MTVSKIKGNYYELKPLIGQFKKVLVTGPHGAGNKITTKVIAHDEIVNNNSFKSAQK